MEAILFHTEIQIKTIAKNGGEKFGANAECKFWVGDSKMKMDVSQYGKTKKEAEEKLMKFLTNNGKNQIECVGKNIY
jgi:hypothetical protein